MSALPQPPRSDTYHAFIQKPFDLDQVMAVLRRLTADPA